MAAGRRSGSAPSGFRRRTPSARCSTAAPIEPLLGIYAAVTRRTLDGKNPDGWVPQEKISVEEALRAYTAGNAYGVFAEDRRGRLAPGYLADLVLLDQDLTRIPPEEIEKAAV